MICFIWCLCEVLCNVDFEKYYYYYSKLKRKTIQYADKHQQ